MLKLDPPVGAEGVKKEARSDLKWSDSSKFVAVRAEKHPRYLFIFEVLTLEIHSIVAVGKGEDIREIDWDSSDSLYFSWACHAFGIWSPDSMKAVNPTISKPFKITGLRFNPDKSALEIKGSKNICFFYVDNQTKPKRSQERESEFGFGHHPARQSDSVNLRKVDLSMSETARKSQEIRTQDLIDEYDMRNTPEKLNYVSHESFGGGTRNASSRRMNREGPGNMNTNRFGNNNHRFEE